MKPVDVGIFLEDPRVEGIIESTKTVVKVDDKTGDGLKGRSGRIEGLKPDRYYMVEKELDANGNPVVDPTGAPVYPQYVTDHIQGLGAGALYKELKYITRISGGNINGLVDFHTYTVRAAEPLAPSSGNLPYTDEEGAVSKPVTDGVINIAGINGTGFLDLSSVLAGTYEVMAVYANNSSNPWAWDDSQTSASWTSFELEGPNTEVDYVFVNKNDFSDFKVLRVIIGQSVGGSGNFNFDIQFTFTDQSSASVDVSVINRGVFDGTGMVTLTLDPPTGGGTWSDINWYIEDLSGTGNPLIIDNSSGFWPVLADDSFNVTVTAVLSGALYSAVVTITVED